MGGKASGASTSSARAGRGTAGLPKYQEKGAVPVDDSEDQTNKKIETLSRISPEGVLLPATARHRSILKTVAAATVFAFTFTSLLLSGWAMPEKNSHTLRVNQLESSGAKAGLEEALNPNSS